MSQVRVSQVRVSQVRVLITGAAGYVGSLLGARLAAEGHAVIGTDLRARTDLPFPVRALDVRDSALHAVIKDEQVTHVVHLASVLESKGNPALEYDIDVNGTRNVVEGCVRAGVRHLTVASSGAAYGYHADNPPWLTEAHPLRATKTFAYAHHKRVVEQLLAEYRSTHPALGQLVFRIGTVLGATTNNQITALFLKPRVLAIRGSDSPFVFIWDQDVVGAIAHGVRGSRTGTFNVAGDGSLTISEIAAALGRPLRVLSAGALRAALTIGRALGLSRYGPEQLDFLRYRPVLDNRRLKEEFGYVPVKTSSEALATFAAAHRSAGAARPL